MDVEVEVNMILQKDMLAESPLQQKTVYQVFCYAEDDWKIQALALPSPVGMERLDSPKTLQYD